MKFPSTALPLLALIPAFALGACGPDASSRLLTPPGPPTTLASAPPSIAGSTPAPTAKPTLGTFGVDLMGMDASAKPGASFDAYASGKWAKQTTIPADRSRWGMFDKLREESDANVRTLLDEATKAKAGAGTNAQKTNDFYAAYMDTAAIDAKGLAPAKASLDAIAAAKTYDDVAKLMGRVDLPTSGPFGARVRLDLKDPDRYVVWIRHAGLGLPERDYYSKKDAQFVDIRAKYLAHLKKVLELGGDRKAAANADAILALETQIAEDHWPIAERRERDKTYNPRTLAELQKDAPEFPWKAFLDVQGLGGEAKYVVGEVTAIPKLAKLFKATPVATWKAYLTYHFLRQAADVLPRAFDEAVFDFYGRTLNGQPEQRERWKRAVTAVNDALGEAVGEQYVARFFQPRAKEEMDRLVENLRKAYATRIEGVDWMTPETKKVALEKLASFRPKIGYPTKWKSYAALDVQRGDAFGNALRVLSDNYISPSTSIRSPLPSEA